MSIQKWIQISTPKAKCASVPSIKKLSVPQADVNFEADAF